ncbi:MAG: aconitate hydratase AcnA [Deltaproteobacteria bacterium]|nr:aconitate hydratase AcnA [Deltaproteobacteria bacterium]
MAEVGPCYDHLETASGRVGYYSLRRLEEQGFSSVGRLPFSIKVLLEGLLRKSGTAGVTGADAARLASWSPRGERQEVAFFPARVLLQDFTGVPAVVDLAALRSAMARLGAESSRINPLIPVDLVIDHSFQIDRFGSADSCRYNTQREFERNGERYRFLRWGQKAFRNFRVVPPGTGICHQVNLEHLAGVVQVVSGGPEPVALPDSLVGTDSHTTMINGLGVVGWGVGGIEAEAAMLGQPVYFVAPDVVGVRLTGELPQEATATDLVLAVTQLLRKRGVVEKFVEFFGPGLDGLTLPDRATLANMAPEYGATIGYFPVDEETLRYLRQTGRSDGQVDLVERYTKEQGLFRVPGAAEPAYTETLELDMSGVVPSLAGPPRPHDRIPLAEAKESFAKALATYRPGAEGERPKARVELAGLGATLADGAVVIASITSCTNTSNPSVMVGAGLLAKKAVERGLAPKPWVKTSLAPGSRVVMRYLDRTGLTPYLQALRFHLVGYGCATCIGNSGPLAEEIGAAIRAEKLVAASVLSGNRNFEGRIHALTRANYLASPLLVVAYALAGTVDIDFAREPLGTDPNGEPVYLKDVWPTRAEVEEAAAVALDPALFLSEYASVFEGDELWQRTDAGGGELFGWAEASTYIQEPPYFEGLTREPAPLRPLREARVLAFLGDSVTTDHISPAGDIPAESPAGTYLRSRGVPKEEFNSYGSRRGNHEVMVRGTFANIRIRNRLAPGTEGGVTVHLPAGDLLSIYDAACRYQAEGTPLVILAGKDYGMGSSRDWAAKGTQLLGVRAVIAESFERIHRSNLVGMGVLPLQFRRGDSAGSLGLTGREVYDIPGAVDLQPGQEVEVTARAEDGSEKRFSALVRIDTPVELDYYRNGGILPAVLRSILKG